MVAIKSTDKKLNSKDIWPGLPWTWEDTHRIQEECRQKVIDSGITEELYLSFRAAREWEIYMQMFPSLRERQEILAKIYPPIKPLPRVNLSEEEMEYVVNRLFGANDPVGQSIVSKLKLVLEMK
jgi:hypothetical protein